MSIDNFTGVYREYHDEEKTEIKSEVFIINGKKQGLYKSYYDNGCELSSTDNSKRENLSLTNSLGQLKEEVNYIDDKKEGMYKSYHDNGQLKEEVNYIDDKKEGMNNSYYDDEQLKEEVNHIDNKKEGMYKSYYDNGQLYREINYSSDKKKEIYKFLSFYSLKNKYIDIFTFLTVYIMDKFCNIYEL